MHLYIPQHELCVNSYKLDGNSVRKNRRFTVSVCVYVCHMQPVESNGNG